MMSKNITRTPDLPHGKQDNKFSEQIKNVLKYAVKTLIFCYQAILLLTSL